MFQNECSEPQVSEMRLLFTRSLWPGADLADSPTVFVPLALLQIDFLILLAVSDHGLCVRIKSMATLILTVKER